MHKKFVTKRDLNLAKGFLKTFGVSVTFTQSSNWAYCKRSHVCVATDEVPKNEFWSAVFHELVHILCTREGKYPLYHRGKPRGMTQKEFTSKVRSTALKAERYVDKRAKKLMKEFFPKVPYAPSYQSIEDVVWYREWLNKSYPDRRG